MNFNRTKNTVRNILFGYLNKIMTIVFPFIIRTAIIKRIGAEFLGLNSLFSSILQVLNLTELGFSSAVVFSMYKPIAENDNDTLCAILNFFRKVYFFIGIVILILGMLVIPFLKYLIKGNPPVEINIYLLYSIYLLSSVISYLLFAYRGAILSAYQRNDITSNINTVVYFFIYSLQLCIIFLTKNYYLYALASLIGTILTNIFTALLTKKYFPNIKCKGKISFSLKKDIKTKVSGLLVSRLSTTSRNALDSIFLSSYLGLIETAIYNNYFYILNAISGFIVIIFSSMLAGVGNSIVTTTVDKNYEDMKRINFLYMWITGFCTVCLFTLYQPFIEFCWGKDMLFPIKTVALFCLYFYSMRINDILGLYFEANGLWWKARYIFIAETILNVVFNAVFGKLWGASGIVMATLLSIMITTNIFLPFVTFRMYFNDKRISFYFFEQVVYFCITTVVCFVVNLCCSLLAENNLVNIGIKLLINILLSNLLYFLFYFRTNNFKMVKVWIYTKLKK